MMIQPMAASARSERIVRVMTPVFILKDCHRESSFSTSTVS